MRPIELTPRLLAVAERVTHGAPFVDVGTDHGRLPVWLLERGVTEAIVATDLREGPLNRARRTAARHGLESRISFRLGNGLTPVSSEEARVISITGMGGETIAAILEAAPWTLSREKRLLLQPMTSVPDLRRWLSRHGYTIEEETLIREGETLYVIFTVAAGEMSLTPAEEWAGRQWPGMKSPHRAAYLRLMTGRVARVLEGLRLSNQAEDMERLTVEEMRYQGLLALQKEWDTWLP